MPQNGPPERLPQRNIDVVRVGEEIFSELHAMLAKKEESEEILQGIKIEDLISEQAQDEFCLELRRRLSE